MRLMLHKKIGFTSLLLVSLFLLLTTSCTEKRVQQEISDDSSPLNLSSQESFVPSSEDEKTINPPLTSFEKDIINIFTADTITQELIDRFSYTYGYMLMDSAMREIPTLNPEYFLKGAFDVGISKKELLTKEERNTSLFQFQEKLISEAGIRVKELAEKNLKDAESFLAVNNQREGIVTTDSGLQYEIIVPKEGESPTADDVVKVNYRLTYLDGREGDSSVPGIPSTFKISKLVDGFKEGLYLMKVGSTYRFYVHPNLGYGESGSTRIEPNTLLIFDVELVEIVKQ